MIIKDSSRLNWKFSPLSIINNQQSFFPHSLPSRIEKGHKLLTNFFIHWFLSWRCPFSSSDLACVSTSTTAHGKCFVALKEKMYKILQFNAGNKTSFCLLLFAYMIRNRVNSSPWSEGRKADRASAKSSTFTGMSAGVRSWKLFNNARSVTKYV